MDRDDKVGVTYQISSPFGDEAPLQTIHYDNYNLPVAFPLPALQGDAALSGSPTGLFVSDTDMDWDREEDSGSVDSPEDVLTPPRFSQAGMSARPPERFRDYVMG